MDVRASFAIAFLVLFSSLLLNVTGIHQQENVQHMYTMCQNKTNATEADMSALQTSQTIPTTRTGKCLLACVFRESGVMTKEGKYNVEGVYKLAKQSYMTKPEKLMKARQVIDMCDQEVKNENDECDAAAVLANCTMMTSVKLGLESG